MTKTILEIQFLETITTVPIIKIILATLEMKYQITIIISFKRTTFLIIIIRTI